MFRTTVQKLDNLKLCKQTRQNINLQNSKFFDLKTHNTNTTNSILIYHNRSKWIQNLWKAFWIFHVAYKPLNTSIFRSRLVVNQCVWSSPGTFYPTSLVISVNVAGIKSPIITSFIILTHCLTILGAISFFVRKIISLVICILFIAWGRNIYKTKENFFYMYVII